MEKVGVHGMTSTEVVVELNTNGIHGILYYYTYI